MAAPIQRRWWTVLFTGDEDHDRQFLSDWLFEAAYAPLAADIDALFEKWELVVERQQSTDADAPAIRGAA